MPDPKNLKEYECVLRTRVGSLYRWTMSGDETEELIAKLASTQKDFFGRAQRLRTAIESDPPELLLREFTAGTTEARATLYLARACITLGQREKATQLAQHGLKLAGDDAPILRRQLNSILLNQASFLTTQH